VDAGGQKSLELVIEMAVMNCTISSFLHRRRNPPQNYSGSCVLVDGKPKLRVTTRPLKEDQLHDVLENSS